MRPDGKGIRPKESTVKKPHDVPQSAVLALRSNVGMVCRHGPDGEIDQLCMATRLGDGTWATVHDRGVYGDKVRGMRRGDLEVVDLHLHLERDGERVALPVRWALHAPIEPIAFLGVPGDGADAPEFATAADLAVLSYPKIYVPSPTPKDGDTFFGPRRASDIDMDAPFAVKDGAAFGPPRLQNYRSGADDASRVGTPLDDAWASRYDAASRATTVCVQGDMSYSRDGVVGAPVCDAEGRIAGVVVGAGLGNQSDHVGAYVPVDVLLPLARVAKALHDSSGRGGYVTCRVDFVSHESTDVDFGD